MRLIKYTSIIILLMAPVLAHAQSWLWGRLGDGDGNDAYAVATDPSGNVFGAGFTLGGFGTMTFGGVSAPASSGFEQTVWVKYNNAGVPLWAGGTVGANSTYLYNICTDPAGNLLVFGCFSGDTVRIGNITVHNHYVTGDTDQYFVAKIDPSGTALWAICDGAPMTGGLYVTAAPVLSVGGLTTDAAGNVYITGNFNKKMYIGPNMYTPAGNYDVFVAKYSPAGALLWSTSFGGANPDYGFGVTVSSTNNVYVCGAFGSPSMTLGSTTITNSYPGTDQAYIAELSSSTGAFLWAESAVATNVGSFGIGLAHDNYNNVYMTGGFEDTSITFGSATITRTYPLTVPKCALYLVQFSGSSGAVTWSKTIGSNSTSAGVWGYCIAMASCGQIWVSGNYRANITIDTATLTLVSGDDPIFIAGYDLTGGVVGYSGLGSGGDDQNGIACDGNGNVFLCSDFLGSNLVVGPDTLVPTGGSSEFFYMGKYSNAIIAPDTTGMVHDTLICSNGTWSTTLRGATGYTNYYWNNGSDADTLNVSDSGTFLVYCVTCATTIVADTFHISVLPSDTSFTAADTAICSNAGPLTLTAASGFSSYLWSTGATSSTITVTTAGNYFSVMEQSCVFIVDTFHVKFNTAPTVSLGNDTGFCAPYTYTLAPIEPSSITFLWNDGTTGRTLTVADSGVYKVTVTDTLGCHSSDSVTVWVTPVPVVNLGNDTTICTGVQPLLQSSVTYPTGTTYLWNTGAATSSITAIMPGSYWLLVNIGGCSNSDTVLVANIYDTVNFPMKDTAICKGNNVNVRALGTPGMTYQWIPTAGIATSNVLGPVIAPDTSAMYYVTANISTCPPIIDSFFIDVQPNPWVYIAGNLSVCQHDTLHLHANITPGWYPNYTISWSPSAYIDDTSLQTVVFTAGPISEVYVTVTTSAGCTGKDSDLVVVRPDGFASLDTMIKLCPHDSAIIAPSSTDPGTTYTWHPGLYLNDSTAANPVVRALTNMTYYAVARSSYGCLDTLYAKVTIGPAAAITLGDSVTLYPGQSYQIPTQSNCATFEWMPASGLNNPFLSSPLATPLVSTKYIVTATSSWGCVIRDSVNIFVDDGSLMAVPNAFSPGEGPNSVFKLILQGEASLNYFRVFDRWGNLVFSTTNVNEGWDGTYNGKPQPLGVYVYQIEAVASDGASFQKTGNVTLLR